MENGSLITFIALSLIVIIAALYVGVDSLKTKKRGSRWIASSAVFGILSVAFYSFRILAESGTSFLVLSSFCTALAITLTPGPRYSTKTRSTTSRRLATCSIQNLPSHLESTAYRNAATMKEWCSTRSSAVRSRISSLI